MAYKLTPFTGKEENFELVQWIRDELTKIEVSFFDLDGIQMKEINVAPSKPRNGMVVLADGTNWDPGSGAGFYGRYGGNWVKLG